MNEYPHVPFGEIGTVIAGQHIEASLYNRAGKGTPYLTGPDDFGDISPKVSKWTHSPKVFAEDTDVLLTVKGAGAGKCNLAIAAAIGRQLMALRPDKSRLDRRYLFRALQSLDRQLGQLGQGATVPGIAKPAVERFPIPLPPLSEQKRIAAILDQADAIRRKRRQALADVAGLRLSMFYDLFGRPFAGQHGWRQTRLDECGTVKGGITLGSRRNGYSLQLPYLRVANVYRDRIDLSEVKSIGVTEAEAARTRLEAGDILVVEGHGNPDEIGRCAVWDGSISRCLHQNHLIRITPDAPRVTPNYLSTFLNSPEGRRQLIRAGKTTSGLNTISLSNVRATIVELPPLRIQEQYEEALGQSTCIAKTIQQASVAAGELFDSLVQRAFCGERE